MLKGVSGAYNLGNSVGFSVQQVIDVAREVTGQEINVIDSPRRLGDPAVLVANANLARVSLGWEPEYESIQAIIKTAWDWESSYSRKQ
jgi:UDP-glucose 4-epimerase